MSEGEPYYEGHSVKARYKHEDYFLSTEIGIKGESQRYAWTHVIQRGGLDDLAAAGITEFMRMVDLDPRVVNFSDISRIRQAVTELKEKEDKDREAFSKEFLANLE